MLFHRKFILNCRKSLSLSQLVSAHPWIFRKLCQHEICSSHWWSLSCLYCLCSRLQSPEVTAEQANILYIYLKVALGWLWIWGKRELRDTISEDYLSLFNSCAGDKMKTLSWGHGRKKILPEHMSAVTSASGERLWDKVSGPQLLPSSWYLR